MISLDATILGNILNVPASEKKKFMERPSSL